jgi:hypothetical protein
MLAANLSKFKESLFSKSLGFVSCLVIPDIVLSLLFVLLHLVRLNMLVYH